MTIRAIMRLPPSCSSLRFLGLSVVLAIAIAITCLVTVCLANDSNRSIDDQVSGLDPQQTARTRFTLRKLFDFERFKRVFKKSYSIVEEVARARLFLGRAFRSFVSAVSYKHGKASSYLAINHMSDWTPDEVRRIDLAPEALTEVLDSMKGTTDKAALDDEPAPLPAASLDEVESTLRDIAENKSQQQSGLRLLADELNGSQQKSQRKRRDVGGGNNRATRGLKRQISLDDLAREPAGQDVDVSQRVESNNPHYEPPELTSFGSSDDTPRSVLPWRDAKSIISLPGMEFLNSVVQTASDTLSGNDESEGRALPDEIFIDHRGDCMFAPRSQGECGSCYAFAAISVYEWLYCKATGKKVAFSEQYLVDCGQSSGLDGCAGGYLSKVPDFINTNGMELRANYPYRQREDQCPYDDSTPSRNRGYLRISIKRLEAVPESNFEDKLKTGPLVVALYVSDAFHEYGGGVHDGAGCDAKRGHAVVLVGSGREDNQEYWLLRNSYSPTYGEGGYYKMNKNAKHCISNQQAYLYSGITGTDKQEGINNHYRSRAIKRRYHDYVSTDINFDEERK